MEANAHLIGMWTSQTMGLAILLLVGGAMAGGGFIIACAIYLFKWY